MFDAESLDIALASLDPIVKSELKLLQGDRQRLLLGGTSQGAVVSLQYLLTKLKRIRGMISIAGHCAKVPLPLRRKQGTPMLFLRPAGDRCMPWTDCKDAMLSFVKRHGASLRFFQGSHLRMCTSGASPLLGTALRSLIKGWTDAQLDAALRRTSWGPVAELNQTRKS